MESSPGTVFVDTSAWKAFYDENDTVTHLYSATFHIAAFCSGITALLGLRLRAVF